VLGLERAGALPTELPSIGALARIVPGWGAVRNDPSLVEVAEAVLRLLARVTADAVLLVLEDLHWADPETLAVVEYLGDNLAGQKVAVLATLRPEPSAAAALIRRLAARRSGVHLDLAALPSSEVTALVGACLGVETDALPAGLGALLVKAEGLPLLVEDLLAAAARSGALCRGEAGRWLLAQRSDPFVPLRFADSVTDRLAALDADARQVVRVAAVLGRRFDDSLLGGITGLGADAVLAALESGYRAQLLTSAGTAFEFRHALTREVVLDEILPPARAELSRRAADALEATAPDSDEDLWLRIAELRLTGRQPEHAAHQLLRVGRQALARGALNTASGLLRRGRELARPGPLRAELGRALMEALTSAGDINALPLGEAVLAEAHPDGAAEIHLMLARAALTAGRTDDAQAHLDNIRAGDNAALQARAGAVAAHVALAEMGVDRLRTAERLARRAATAAAAAQLPDVACEALEVLGRCARVRSLARAEQAFTEALQIAERAGSQIWRVRALNELGTISMFRDVRPDRLEYARREADRAGAVATGAGIDVNLAALYVMQANYPAAIEAARRCHRTATAYRLPVLAAAELFHGVIATHEGRFADMARHITAAEALAGDDPDILVGTWAMCRAMRSLLQENRPRAHYEFAIAQARLTDRPALAINPSEGPGLLLRAIDGQASAAEVADYAGNRANGSRWTDLWAGLAASAVTGDPEVLSAAMTAGQPLPLFRALGLRLVAERALQDGWGNPPRWLLESAVFFADHHPRVASACRSLLRRAGLSPPRNRRVDRAVPSHLRRVGVTAREAEVLELIGERIGNREIAARLHLSARTVEKHVANLLRKTGAADRVALVCEAEDGGAAPIRPPT
jgi:DNA-binding CsgD family transcriptional regulator/tetratricopeptide (TPR) repeat protein